MSWAFRKEIVSVQFIPRGRGQVRLITLACGHELESMKPIPKGKTAFVCETCHDKGMGR